MADVTILDATGLRCPLPVIRMEAALRRLPEGAALRITADDPIAAVDIPHFAREAGWRCDRAPGPEGVCVFLVTREEKP
ncbi:MAG: sulfurtransferase TusA family protein [Pseudomonadota bacterium]